MEMFGNGVELFQCEMFISSNEMSALSNNGNVREIWQAIFHIVIKINPDGKTETELQTTIDTWNED